MLTDEQVQSVRRMTGGDHGLATIATQRRDGSIQCSVVNAGVFDHPTTGAPVVALVARGGTVKLRHLRRIPRATVVFRVGWRWIAVEGGTTIAGPDDPLVGVPLAEIPRLLRDIFLAAGGRHDNWTEYDRVMAEERRTAVFVEMERVYSSR